MIQQKYSVTTTTWKVTSRWVVYKRKRRNGKGEKSHFKKKFVVVVASHSYKSIGFLMAYISNA